MTWLRGWPLLEGREEVIAGRHTLVHVKPGRSWWEWEVRAVDDDRLLMSGVVVHRRQALRVAKSWQRVYARSRGRVPTDV